MLIRFRVTSCLVAALAAATVLLAGCQRAQHAVADAAIERASGGKVKVTRDGDRTTIKTPEGEMAVRTGDSLALPQDFPGDVYLPKTYKVNSVMDLGGMQVVSMQAQGNVAGLFADARDAMAKQGWKQTMAMQNSADTAMLTFEKPKRAAVLSFNDAQSGNNVVMSVQLRKE